MTCFSFLFLLFFKVDGNFTMAQDWEAFQIKQHAFGPWLLWKCLIKLNDYVLSTFLANQISFESYRPSKRLQGLYTSLSDTSDSRRNQHNKHGCVASCFKKRNSIHPGKSIQTISPKIIHYCRLMEKYATSTQCLRSLWKETLLNFRFVQNEV